MKKEEHMVGIASRANVPQHGHDHWGE
ncbi:rCG59761 [Rattus norvegicus]|uniref:RCG59761 n=1 Tax=Rattus norvegicus TaxID=10116 RepID=A6HR31_RAT|nr:rCG59761 [Rattus norvegicus]